MYTKKNPRRGWKIWKKAIKIKGMNEIQIKDVDVGVVGYGMRVKKRPQGKPAAKKRLTTTYSPIVLYTVPSALQVLTAVFGKGTGVPLAL